MTTETHPQNKTLDQTSINILLAEMNRIANGDLTVQTTVSDDATGPIALSINKLVAQLRQIVTNVQGASLQVSQSAKEIHTITEDLSNESAGYATRIDDTTAAVDEMVDSIRQVADNTSTSAAVAEEARQTAARGSQAVSNTINGMDRIRNQVICTSQRIKHLGETSEQIGEIVQLISDVADRTSILALNASIQAAMAGEAGVGFAVVAEEVDRLSKRCNDSTKQIGSLVRNIQTEISDAIVGMEESIAEVVEGSKIASQAGEALSDIDAVSNRLAELINSISFAAKQQARGGLLVSRSMNEIAGVMRDTAAGTKQAAGSVSFLATLADKLRSSVRRFRVPQQRTD